MLNRKKLVSRQVKTQGENRNINPSMRTKEMEYKIRVNNACVLILGVDFEKCFIFAH